MGSTCFSGFMACFHMKLLMRNVQQLESFIPVVERWIAGAVHLTTRPSVAAKEGF